jgi:hypothetical protein
MLNIKQFEHKGLKIIADIKEIKEKLKDMESANHIIITVLKAR